jgi:hypothetical protein
MWSQSDHISQKETGVPCIANVMVGVYRSGEGTEAWSYPDGHAPTCCLDGFFIISEHVAATLCGGE